MMINSLPKEMLETTFFHVGFQDLNPCFRVSKHWNQVLSNAHSLWKMFAEKIPIPIGPEVSDVRKRIYTILSNFNKICTLSSLKWKLPQSFFPKNLTQELQKFTLFPSSTLEEVKATKEYLDARSIVIVWGKMAKAISQTGPELQKLKTVEEMLDKAQQFSHWCMAHQEQLKKVTTLHLNSCYLTKLPSEIRLLTGLHELDLSYNQLPSIPQEIGQLMELKELNLYKNYLSNLPKETTQLTGLQKLDLSHNQLSSFPKEICQMDLKELNLIDNKITAIPEEVSQLKNLNRLRLDYNLITHIPQEIRQLTKLRILDLSHNQITTIPQEIKELTKLRTLDLSDNPIVDIPEELHYLQHLGILNLGKLFYFGGELIDLEKEEKALNASLGILDPIDLEFDLV